MRKNIVLLYVFPILMLLCFVLIVRSMSWEIDHDNRLLYDVIMGSQAFLLLASTVFGLLHWVWLFKAKRSNTGPSIGTRVSLGLAIVVTTPYLLVALFTIPINIMMFFGADTF